MSDRHSLYEDYPDFFTPAYTILACSKPCAIGEVMMIPPFRFAVQKELTEEEFNRELARNLAHPARTMGSITTKNGIATPDVQRHERPDPSCKYYYRAGYIGRMKEN